MALSIRSRYIPFRILSSFGNQKEREDRILNPALGGEIKYLAYLKRPR
jgi:hypothetical protein